MRAVIVLAVAAAVAVAGASAAPPPPPPPAAKIAACNTAKIGLLAPLTGPYPAVGRDQLTWASLALDTFNTANGTHFTLRKGDTRLVPKQASRVASAFPPTGRCSRRSGPRLRRR